MAINAFSDFSITISDGGTVPSLDYLSNKTYVDIGSGNVLRVSWDTPIALNNVVENYIVYILMYDSTSASYKYLYNATVGKVNEFYLSAALFESVKQSFIPLSICIEAVSKYGAAYNGTSNLESVNVSRGCGTYIRVDDGYVQPIMKRALAFAKLNYLILTDEAGAPLKDSNGNIIYGKASSMQDASTGWTLMQEFYNEGTPDAVLLDAEGRAFVDANGATIYVSGSGPRKSNILYEVLTDQNGEIITDLNNEAIYVL